MSLALRPDHHFLDRVSGSERSYGPAGVEFQDSQTVLTGPLHRSLGGNVAMPHPPPEQSEMMLLVGSFLVAWQVTGLPVYVCRLLRLRHSHPFPEHPLFAPFA